MTGFHATDSLESITSINPPVNVIRGTIEADNLYGTLDRDDIFGDDGDDILVGNAGMDRLFGGNGDDALYAEEGNDWMSGDGGRDQLFGGPGRNTMLGGTGKDVVFGAGDNDRIFGGADADWLSGGLGRDIVAGGAGNDHLKGDDGNDSLQGNAGRDTIYGGLGRDDLRGGAGNDDLRGGWGNDRLFGDAGNDKLFGERGNDQLSGGSGNDVIYGDGGPDYTLQARFAVPVAAPNYPFPREMILTDGETLVVRNGWSELLTYDVDTQHLIGQFTPLPQGRPSDVSVSDERILIGSAQRGGTTEHPLARLYDTSGHVLRDFINPDPTDAGFGTRVALKDDHAVVVSDRAAYVYDAGNGHLEHTIPLPPNVYGQGWPPLDVELSGDTIAIHAGAYEGEEVYILNADTGAFVRQIEFPPKIDGAQDSSVFRFFELAGDDIVFNEPMVRESNPDGTRPRTNEQVDFYDADTGHQIHVLQREAPESLSPIYSRMVYNIAADNSEVAVADIYFTGPNSSSISPIVSVLDTRTGEQIQGIADLDNSGGPLGNLIGFAFSGGVLAVEQHQPGSEGPTQVSLFWRDHPQDGGNDTIGGGPGNDRLFGGGGRDRLSGDAGNDRLFGGPGADVFVVGQNSGHDQIMDFRPGDRILFASAGATSPADLEITGTPTGTLITADENSVELIGIHENAVNLNWFMFA